LTCENFLSSKRNSEPGGTIDFREGDDPAAAGRPFDRSIIAADVVGIEISFQRVAMNDLADPLAYAAELLKPAVNWYAEFLREFAPGCVLRILFVGYFSLRDRPRAPVALGPVRPARVDEENLDTVVVAMIRQNASTCGCHASNRFPARAAANAPERIKEGRRPMHMASAILFWQMPTSIELLDETKLIQSEPA
jgi:hypothetical protein